jgi:hypothetical protein
MEKYCKLSRNERKTPNDGQGRHDIFCQLKLSGIRTRAVLYARIRIGEYPVAFFDNFITRGAKTGERKALPD